ncbi:unnamed protein product [marine sediment metagenome]|uniref:Gfo/Idh/MocA-like oxidoreductase N-terminal domain-containing protein n=1 Tax=marine sediment metagenome TaxID=412755 RepID=X1KSM7_9ZZZZ
MEKKIRFGIIGAGTIAIESHIPAIKNAAGAELVAIGFSQSTCLPSSAAATVFSL